MFTTAPFVVSTSVLKIDPVLDFFPSVSWCFWNVVDLVNDVLRKRKYFNPQGWETFGEALREANVPQDLIGHVDRWRYISQTEKNTRYTKSACH
jgi:hypothetical protein